MTSIYDVNPNQLIEKAGEELKKLGLKKPLWADFVKTGVFKEKPPTSEDWWYVRLASVLRTVYKLGPIGTSKLRKKYGGRKNRGHKPEKTFRGSGSVLRKALQQLEQAGFVSNVEKGVHKGRIITKKGKSFLDKVAAQVCKNKPRPIKREAKEAEVSKDDGAVDAVNTNLIKEETKEIIEKKSQEPVKKEENKVVKKKNEEIIEKKENLPANKGKQEIVE